MDTTVKIDGLVKENKYELFYMASSDNPLSGVYTDVVQHSIDATATVVTPAFASNITTAFFTLLALLFGLFVLI